MLNVKGSEPRAPVLPRSPANLNPTSEAGYVILLSEMSHSTLKSSAVPKRLVNDNCSRVDLFGLELAQLIGQQV